MQKELVKETHTKPATAWPGLDREKAEKEDHHPTTQRRLAQETPTLGHDKEGLPSTM